jgi:hypothetical protein
MVARSMLLKKICALVIALPARHNRGSEASPLAGGLERFPKTFSGIREIGNVGRNFRKNCKPSEQTRKYDPLRASWSRREKVAVKLSSDSVPG